MIFIACLNGGIWGLFLLEAWAFALCLLCISGIGF